MGSSIFMSDGCCRVHPNIIDALVQANNGYSLSYGYDDYTQIATQIFRDYFGKEVEVFFVANGTAANTLTIKSLIRSYDALICSEDAHLNKNEGGAIEAVVGSKLVTVKSYFGKIDCDDLQEKVKLIGDPYMPQPKLIVLSQATEFGTVYSLAELQIIKDIARKNKLFLYMDGARLANAAAYLDVSLKKICEEFDAVFFGNTKNGGMFGEAVIFFNIELAKQFKYMQKQNLQLIPKTRFIATQYIALFEDNLWLNNAMVSNLMAKTLARELSLINGISILYPVEANLVFVKIPPRIINRILQKFCLSVIDKEAGIVRFVTSFDTKEKEISLLKSFIEHLLVDQS